MLTTLIVVLLILWLLGVVIAPVGRVIHVLLIVALLLVVVRLVEGRPIL